MAEIDARKTHQDDEKAQKARDRRPAPGRFEKSESQKCEVAGKRRGREDMAAGESGRVQLAHDMDQVRTGTWSQNDHLDDGSERHVARREDGGHGFPSKTREVECCDRYESEDEGLWRKTDPADITHELIDESAMIALNRARDRQLDREVRHEVGGDGETD